MVDPQTLINLASPIADKLVHQVVISGACRLAINVVISSVSGYVSIRLARGIIKSGDDFEDTFVFWIGVLIRGAISVACALVAVFSDLPAILWPQLTLLQSL